MGILSENLQINFRKFLKIKESRLFHSFQNRGFRPELPVEHLGFFNAVQGQNLNLRGIVADGIVPLQFPLDVPAAAVPGENMRLEQLLRHMVLHRTVDQFQIFVLFPGVIGRQENLRLNPGQVVRAENLEVLEFDSGVHAAFVLHEQGAHGLADFPPQRIRQDSRGDPFPEQSRLHLERLDHEIFVVPLRIGQKKTLADRVIMDGRSVLVPKIGDIPGKRLPGETECSAHVLAFHLLEKRGEIRIAVLAHHFEDRLNPPDLILICGHLDSPGWFACVKKIARMSFFCK